MIRFERISFVMIFAAISISQSAFGQAPPPARGPCGAGAPVNGSCGSPANQGGVGSGAPDVWRNSFGAMGIATDGKLFAVEMKATKRIAKNLVIKYCGKDCQLVSQIRNGCQVILNSPTKTYVGGGANMAMAIKEAKDKCSLAGDVGCVDLFYKGCSLPVRVR